MLKRNSLFILLTLLVAGCSFRAVPLYLDTCETRYDTRVVATVLKDGITIPSMLYSYNSPNESLNDEKTCVLKQELKESQLRGDQVTYVSFLNCETSFLHHFVFVNLDNTLLEAMVVPQEGMVTIKIILYFNIKSTLDSYSDDNGSIGSFVLGTTMLLTDEAGFIDTLKTITNDQLPQCK